MPSTNAGPRARPLALLGALLAVAAVAVPTAAVTVSDGIAAQASTGVHSDPPVSALSDGSRERDLGSVPACGGVYPPPEEGAEVTFMTDLNPGSSVTVVLRFADGDEGDDEVVLRNGTTVDGAGAATATFDLSGFDGRTFVASLRRDGRIVEASEGRVGVPRASVTIWNQSVGDPEHGNDPGAVTTVEIRRVVLEQGGFVAIHRAKPTGPVLGVSRYLVPGTHEGVAVPLSRDAPTGDRTLVAMPHRDTDCDRIFDFLAEAEDGPYESNRTDPVPVTDAATVSFPTPTPTPSPTSTGTPTPTPTPTALPTVTETPITVAPTTSKPTTAAGTTTSAPGFAFVAAAAALLVVVYVAAWRR